MIPSIFLKNAEKMVDKERDTTGSFSVQQEYLKRFLAGSYEADITYGTNHEFGFDYLRIILLSQRPAGSG